jgi:hypothetical protein
MSRHVEFAEFVAQMKPFYDMSTEAHMCSTHHTAFRGVLLCGSEFWEGGVFTRGVFDLQVNYSVTKLRVRRTWFDSQ